MPSTAGLLQTGKIVLARLQRSPLLPGPVLARPAELRSPHASGVALISLLLRWPDPAAQFVLPCVLLRADNPTRWLLAPAVRSALLSLPNPGTSTSKDLPPVVAFPPAATRTWSDDFVPAIGLSWRLRVLSLAFARLRTRHPEPTPPSDLPLDNSGPATGHLVGPFLFGLQPSPVRGLALSLRTWLPAPSVANRARSRWGRPHNRIATLQQGPVSSLISARTQIDSESHRA